MVSVIYDAAVSGTGIAAFSSFYPYLQAFCSATAFGPTVQFETSVSPRALYRFGWISFIRPDAAGTIGGGNKLTNDRRFIVGEYQIIYELSGWGFTGVYYHLSPGSAMRLVVLS
jgi:hypothetical protein